MHERARLVALGWVALGVLLFLPPAARAAEVIEVRLGAHPEYTRVVFELDRPAAYEIQRGSGKSELVVTLQAGSIVRNVKSPRKSLIDSIQMTPTREGSQARIALARDGLSLKQMILADPPRIVLDLIAPAGFVAETSPATEQAAASPAKPKARAAVPMPAAKAPGPVNVIAVPSAPAPPIIKLESPAPAKPVAAAAAMATKKAPAPAPVAVAASSPTQPSAPAAETTPEDTTGMAQQVIAIALLPLLLVAWFVVRSRRGRIPVPSRGKLEAAEAEAEPSSANPFVAQEASEAGPEDPSPSEEIPSAEPEVDNPGGALALGDAEELATPVDETSAFVREAADEAAMERIRGLESLVASLQGRLEETLDARERMERQMAAQNEELRVQRAAIARTQRAVRNINRPEGESSSDPAVPVVD